MAYAWRQLFITCAVRMGEQKFYYQIEVNSSDCSLARSVAIDGRIVRCGILSSCKLAASPDILTRF